MVDRSLLGVINVIWLGLSRLLCGSLPRSQTLLSPWFYLWCRKTWLDDVLLLVWNLFLPEAKKWFSWGAHHRIVQSYEDRFEVKRHFFKDKYRWICGQPFELTFRAYTKATLSKHLLPKAILFWRYTGKKYIAALLTYQQRYKIFDMLIQMTWTGLDINDLY